MADVCDDNESDYFAKFLIRAKRTIDTPGYREFLVFGILQDFARNMARYYSPELDEQTFIRTHLMESTWNNDGVNEQWHRANEEYNECPDFLRFTLKKYDDKERGIEFRITRDEQTLEKMRFLYTNFDRIASTMQSAGEFTYDVQKNFDNDDLSAHFLW